MDMIRKEISYGITKLRQNATGNAKSDEISSTCKCTCITIYNIPCYHILSKYDVIPLEIVHPRWQIDDSKYP